MFKERISYLNGSVLKINQQNALIGIVVGILISIFRSIMREQIIPSKAILFNILFSTLITLSITNSVIFYQRYLKPKKMNILHFVFVYYTCNVIGMIIGVELSYAVLALAFDVPYNLMGHLPDYKFSFIVVLIVGTILYIYHAQRATMDARLKEKELDLVKIKQLKTQAELQTLQSKINPHFLYNSLNSIASLIHEDPDKAEEMTLKLSRLFRYSINTQQENLATVKEEMEIVNTYLDIEKVRFGDRITFSTFIDDDLLQSRIPRFLIQPLVENALKHGLNHTAHNGQLKISLTRQNQYMMIKVADNGLPFPDELNMGYGLQSTYDKLSLLYNDDYEMQLINLPEKHIAIRLPLNTILTSYKQPVTCS